MKHNIALKPTRFRDRLSPVGYAPRTFFDLIPSSGTGFVTPSLTFLKCLSKAVTFNQRKTFRAGQHAPSGCLSMNSSGTGFVTPSLTFLKCLSKAVTFNQRKMFRTEQHASSVTGFVTPSLTFLKCPSKAVIFNQPKTFRTGQHAPVRLCSSTVSP